jgi:polysaccharide export outer membrane protein
MGAMVAPWSHFEDWDRVRFLMGSRGILSRRTLGGVCGLLVSLGRASAGEIVLEAVPAPPPVTAAATAAVIGRQDLLEIKVFQLDDFSQTVRVSDDGTISLPLLGQIPVAGLTREEVERTIARRLGERYVNDPQVTVFVREYRSRQVAVTGAVQKPASYEMPGRQTLVEMIALAGGVTKDAARTVVLMRRVEGAAPRRIELPLDGLLDQDNPGANIPLEPGDIIYVPPEELIKIYVNGAVGKPGALEIRKSERMTVLQAVTAAGGATGRASEKRTRVVRTRPDGSKEILGVDLRRVKQGLAEDPVLQADDVVFVPEAYF